MVSEPVTMLAVIEPSRISGRTEAASKRLAHDSAAVGTDIKATSEDAVEHFGTVPSHWPSQIDVLDQCEHMSSGLALTLLVAGLIYLLWGYGIFKWLVMLNAIVLGAWLGATLATHTDAALPCAIIGGVAAGAITWPTMNYAVAVMGALFGAALGVSIWQTVGLDPHFAWTAACMGLILFGLLAFILFRGSLVMYTSLQGSVMIIFGILGLIAKWDEVGPKVTAKLTVAPLLLPMAIFIPTVVGMIYQTHSTPSSAPQGNPPPKK